MRKLHYLGLFALILTACAPVPQQEEMTMDHHHTTIDLTGHESLPEVNLVAHRDPKSGWNLQVLTKNLTFAPQNASLENVDGEGHAHLYVDGVKITRLYGEWYYLDGLTPGEHEIRVNLNANDHSPFTHDGAEIQDIEMVIQE